MSSNEQMTNLQRTRQERANRIADADAGLFDAVEAFFEPFTALHGLEGEYPVFSPHKGLWDAYKERIEAIG